MSKLEISLEYASLRLPGHCPLGVWVIPSPDDIHHWCGTLFIHRGYYAGGIYKFTINFSRNYPFDQQTPQINFQTDCFHPLIDQSNQGSFNLSLKFPNWLPHENFICNLLYYLKSCFKRPGLESIIASGDDSIAYNKHAFRLYRDQTDVFATLAAQSSTLSSSPTSLYDQPSSSSQNEDSNKRIGQKDANGDSRSSSPSKSKHLIKFNPLNDDQFKQLRQKIFLEF
ncbi:hypothetical protein Pst134EA_019577 [Puccinia striiformis f. sp. tritici]|uniref:UBC core domain-containing protein n=1 Tax=Puccinia striiformis f. sp. tritici PST-78 TaxID=1165861 RepID=A0A0L0W1F0_9BASI|nr:hypothetical protein Pst134EA_019577 [Puccinia striiformis f. sp. tritici]KAH9459424.1 hypothetical protein Pst134EA_019577 [Puccinia striiformis f. sp. tritici]KNF05341.1 hypothetical protein PSTG_01557 [Puccinia striiformis f. sp. tritici PST-78]